MRRATLLLSLAALLTGGTLQAYTTLARRNLPSPDTVRVLIPTFGGRELAANVTTLFHLQIWRTLRVAEGDGPAMRGETAWERGMDDVSREVLGSKAVATHSQMILWGEVFPYADGVVVQAYLDLPKPGWSEESFQEWVVNVPAGNALYSVRVDLPSRAYAFEPVVLPTAVVGKYHRLDAIPVYDKPEGGRKVLELGENEFRALRNERDRTLIRFVEGDTFHEGEGWLRLPDVDVVRSEAVDFTAALVRILRRDWAGAAAMLGHILDEKETSVSAAVRIDAFLLRALASAQLGRSWQSDAEAARKLNPDLESTLRYLVALHLHDAARATGKARLAALQEAAAIVKRKRSSFPPDDPLVSTVEQLVAASSAAAGE